MISAETRRARRPYCFKLLATLMLVGLSGCAELMKATTKDPFSVDRGTWTGTVQPIAVRDTRDSNRTWEAAALLVESGTPLPQEVGSPKLPNRALVIMTWERPLRILDPSDLGAPAGARIRLSGMMIPGGGVYAPPSPKRKEREIGVTIPVQPVDQRPTAIIILRGKLELLDK